MLPAGACDVPYSSRILPFIPGAGAAAEAAAVFEEEELEFELVEEFEEFEDGFRSAAKAASKLPLQDRNAF
mgnify:CR=1 FL=1